MRQEIVKAIIERMGSITTDNGYETDSGSKVFEWKIAGLGKDELNSIIVEDPSSELIGIEENDNCDGEVHVKKLTVELYSVISAPAVTGELAGMTSAERLRAVRRDILKAFRTDLSLGGLIEGITLGGDSTDMYSSDRMYAGINMTFYVNYKVPAWED